MADTSIEEQQLNLNVKGPSEVKLQFTIGSLSTIRQVKEQIEKERADFPADSQRLIYSGKVLKDEQTLASYNLKPGHTLHLVRSAARSAPSTGNPAPAAPPTSSTAGAATGGSPPAANNTGVPTTFGTGQNFGTDPLAALNRADLAGPHMANLNPFQGMGLNTNDPNMMMGMMNNPEVQAQMRAALARPEVIDHIIQSNPQLQQMAPQMREMMRSEEFRNMLTDPETMRRMAQMQQMMGGGGGAGGGLGGLGAFGNLGGAGGGSAAPQWPPPGTFGQPPAPGTGAGAEGGTGAAGSGAAQNPFAALGGMGNLFGGGAGGEGAPNPALLSSLLGGQGLGGSPASTTPRIPDEERWASQLEQMQSMGFTNGVENLRALRLSGGSVEGAMSVLFDHPGGLPP